MVDLPTREYPVTTAKQIQPGVSPSEVAQPYAAAAAGLQKFGDAAETVAESLAKQAGAQAVTKDADGNIVVQKAPFIGPAAQVYQHSTQMAALAQADDDAQRANLKLRQEHRNDPEAYLSAADAFAADQRKILTASAGPEVGNALFHSINRSTTQTYHGLLTEKENLDLKADNEKMKVGQSQAEEGLYSLARSGGVTDPKDPNVKALLDKYDTLSRQRMANPRFAYPPEQAAYDREQLLNGMAANAYVYGVNRSYKNAPTKDEAGRIALEKAQEIYDPKYHLTQQQRETFFHRASAEIRANEAIRHQDITELQAAWREVVLANKNNATTPPDLIESFRTKFRELGSPTGVAMVDATASHMNLHDAFQQLPLADKTAQLLLMQRAGPYVKLLSDTAKQYGLDEAMFARQINQESGFRPDLVSPKGAQGIAQFMPATAAQYGVNPNDPQSAIPGAARYMSDLTKMFGGNSGLALAGYNWGQGNVQKWLAAGADPAKMPAETRNYVQSITGRPIEDWTKPDFAQRPTALHLEREGPGVASWLLAARTNDTKDDATKRYAQLIKDWDNGKGQTPPDKEMLEILNAARATDNVDLQAKVMFQLTAIHKVNELSQLSIPEHHEAMVYWRQQLAKGGESMAGAEYVRKLMETRTAAIEEGKKDNPMQTAAGVFHDKVQPPPALTSTDPAALAANIAQRGRISAIASTAWKTPPLPIIDKREAGNITQADPAQTARILGAMDMLPPETWRATMASNTMRDAIDGMVRSYDPIKLNAAMGVLDKFWRQDPIGFGETFKGDSLKRLQMWQTWHDSATPVEMAERFKRADDPALKGAREALVEKANTEMKGWTPQTVATAMGSSFSITPGFVARAIGSDPYAPADSVQAAQLQWEFEKHYRDLRERGVDPDQALKQSGTSMNTIWGTSAAGGGTLMRYPPERYYPQVGGSHDWLTRDVERLIDETKGQMPVTPAPEFEVSSEVPSLVSPPRRYTLKNLVSDAQTESEISNKRPPSYQIIVTDRLTGQDEILTDKAGNHRFAFDPRGPLAESEAKFTAGHAVHQERAKAFARKYGFSLGGE